MIDYQLFAVNTVEKWIGCYLWVYGKWRINYFNLLLRANVRFGWQNEGREEKSKDAVKRENRIGCCCNDTHSLIWIYRQLYFIVCIYIRGIKSSGLRFMVYFESISSACKDFGWQLYLIGCIYRSRIKSSDAKGMGCWGAGLFFFSRQKLFPICTDEVVTNHFIEYTSEEIHVI